MPWWIWLAWLCAGLVCALFSALLYAAIQTVRRVPILLRLQSDAPEPWPRLSILIPACNEGQTIESAMQSLLDEDYPNLEIIAINDRSTDQTREILERLAASAQKLRVHHIDALPEGWLGKVHALSQGYQRSHGEWVLLADADVHIGPGILRKVIAWCEQERIDHFTVIPEIWRADLIAESWWSLGYLLLLPMRLWQVSDPASRAHVGAGAFNLVRRSAFETTEGFEWFKLDVADDWAVGLLMKRNNKRCQIVNGCGSVHLPWYSSLSEMVRGLEKNSFAVIGQYSFARCVGLALLSVVTLWAPFLLLCLPLIPWLWCSGVLSMCLMFLSSCVVHRWLRRPLYLAFLLPLGVLVNALIFVRGGWLGWRRGGVLWRGTLYATEMMKSEMKVRF